VHEICSLSLQVLDSGRPTQKWVDQIGESTELFVRSPEQILVFWALGGFGQELESRSRVNQWSLQLMRGPRDAELARRAVGRSKAVASETRKDLLQQRGHSFEEIAVAGWGVTDEQDGCIGPKRNDLLAAAGVAESAPERRDSHAGRLGLSRIAPHRTT